MGKIRNVTYYIPCGLDLYLRPRQCKFFDLSEDRPVKKLVLRLAVENRDG